jgi:hypothetical protein
MGSAVMRSFWRHIFNTKGTWSLGASLAIACGALCGRQELASAESTMCAVADEALSDAARLRGLAPTQKVPCVVRSTAEVERFLRDTIAAKFPSNLLSMEERVYRAIGVIPDDYPYADRIVQAYVSQIGGYYDPDKKTFVMVDTMATSMQYSVAVHELTHALQDQHFGLVDFLDPKHKNDELMAHAALVEGDATAIMQDSGRKRRVSSSESRSPAPDKPSPLEVPEGLERILLFPYVEGLTFVQALRKEGGMKMINEAFHRPPGSSREVLHPAEYLRGAPQPVEPTVDSLRDPGSNRSFEHTDSLGEFTIVAFLEAGGIEQNAARQAAQGLRGDLVGVSMRKGTDCDVVWRTEWDSPEDARDFASRYKEFLKTRYQREFGGDFVQVSPRKRMKVWQSPQDAVVIVEVVTNTL